MAEIVSKPFREAHADIFECEPLHAEQFGKSLELSALLGKLDQCATHMIDGRIIFIGGYVETAPGVAELFMYPSIYAKQYQKTFFKEARFCVRHLKAKFRRIQCWGEDTELSKRWLEALGFVYEGLLVNYTSDGSGMTIWGLTE